MDNFTHLSLILVLGLYTVLSEKVNKHKPWIEMSYHGLITENTDVVVLDPPLVAIDKDAPIPFAGEICGFRIHGADVPFEVLLLNETSGEGQVRARKPIDCESQKEFSFLIQAHDCGTGPGGPIGKKSHKAVVHIQVDDVNEFPPVFSQPEYRADVIEGHVYDVIVQVVATDQDCSPQYGQICTYHLLTPHTPFAIDRNGNIHATEKLSFLEPTVYELRVTAFDCGQKEALQSIPVYITVKPLCTPGWRGWNEQLTYEPGMDSMPLFPSIHLETCDRVLASARLLIELQNTQVGRSCQRHQSPNSQLHGSCGALADLLPISSSSSTNWTSGLLREGAHDSDFIFRFDGRQAAKIPDWVSPGNLTDHFTIATWMKHEPNRGGQHADKEALLCSSDKDDVSKRHFALYVHNCRLVFLLRREDRHTRTFRPAEFHWKLEQICDKEWHHYVVNIQYPMVELYVDGVTYDPYLVTDDWPIHSPHSYTQLTVGACWQGREKSRRKFTQHFRGYLSALTLRIGRLDPRDVISCQQSCKEGLDMSPLQTLSRNIKYHSNPSQSLLVLEGTDIQQVAIALRSVTYFNTYTLPRLGPRGVRLAAAVQCFNEDECISIVDLEAVVMVQQPDEPRISVSGLEQVTCPASQLQDASTGLTLFPDLLITTAPPVSHQRNTSATVGGVREEVEEEVIPLESCDIVVLGEELKPELEALQLHHTSLLDTHLDYNNSTSSISIFGIDTMENYMRVLRQVRYINLQPFVSVRNFRLTCSEVNTRYISNQLSLQVNILHSLPVAEHVNHVRAPPTFTEVVHHPLLLRAVDSSGVPSLAGIVLLVCVVVLVVVVVVGAYRIHVTLRQDQACTHTLTHTSTLWDQSSLTITVNPMESFEEALAAVEDITEDEQDDEEEDMGNKHDDEDDDLHDDDTSMDSDSEEEEEEEDEEEDENLTSIQQESRIRAQQAWDNLSSF